MAQQMLSAALSQLDVPDENITAFRQKDGVRVLLLQTSRVGGIAHVQIDVRTGDTDEGMPGAGKRECAHFLEHLVASRLFSRKFPDGSAKKWVEDNGIESNAYTSAVRTSHYMYGLAETLETMIDIQIGAISAFLDHLQHMVDLDIFAKEKQAVRRELQCKIDDPDYVMYEALNATLFPNDPRGISQRNDMEAVLTLSKDAVESFFRQFYVANNMLIVIAGPFDADFALRIKNMLNGYDFLPGPKPIRLRPIIIFPYDKIRYITIPESHTVRVTFAWPFPVARYNKDKASRRKVAAASAMTFMLTGGFTSRLLDRLRVKNGLVYSVSASSALDETDDQIGFYEISTSVDRAKVTDLIRETFDALYLLVTDGPSEEEMQKYQTSIKTLLYNRILARHPSSWVEEYSNQALFAEDVDFADKTGITRTAETFSSRLHIRSDEIKDVAKDIFYGSDKNMVFLYGAEKLSPQEQAAEDAAIQRALKDAMIK